MIKNFNLVFVSYVTVTFVETDLRIKTLLVSKILVNSNVKPHWFYINDGKSQPDTSDDPSVEMLLYTCQKITHVYI